MNNDPRNKNQTTSEVLNQDAQRDFNRNADSNVDSTIAPQEPSDRESTRIDESGDHAPTDRRDRESGVPDASVSGD